MPAEKHIAEPATAEEIQKAAGVTKEDKRIVRKVLKSLNLVWRERPGRKRPRFKK